MRMSCDRGDGEPSKRAKEVTRRLAAARRSAAAIYYNRLEYAVRFRLFCAAARSSLASPLAVANPPGCDVAAAPSQIHTPGTFLSPLQVRESCPKQLRGVILLRRGSAQ